MKAASRTKSTRARNKKLKRKIQIIEKPLSEAVGLLKYALPYFHGVKYNGTESWSYAAMRLIRQVEKPA